MSLVRQQQRRDTTANWVLYNPVLLDGELGLDTTVDRFKVGDGVTSWDGLPYADRAEDVAADAARAEAAAAGAVDISNISTSDDVVEALVLGTAGAGPKTRTALSASFVGTGQQVTAIYDDFTDQPDGAISGRTPIVGDPWVTTGGQPSVVSGGAATSTGTGYITATLGGDPSAISVLMEFTDDNAPMTIGVGPGGGVAENVVHFNFGALRRNLTVRRDGGSFDGLPNGDGPWATPIATDGSQSGWYTFLRRGNTVRMIAPDGGVHSVEDPRIGQLWGPDVFLEPNVGARLLKCLVVVQSETARRSLADVALDQGVPPVVDGNGRVVANQNKYGQVAIGYDAATDGPSIDFGPLVVITVLAQAASPGDTTIVTQDRIPGLFSLAIDNGTPKETRTASGGASGTGPYTTTLGGGALANAHPAGAVVIATIVNGWQHARLPFNPDNGALSFPNIITALVYFSGQTAYLTQAAPGVVEVGGAGTGKGGLKTGGGTSAERPDSAAIGPNVQWFDNTLGKPIWSAPGGVWKDATGATV